MIPDSYRSNFRPFYLQPPYAFLSFCSLFLPGIGRGIVAPPLRDGFRSGLRHRTCELANASGRIEFIIVLFMDWSFASGCSPPRLSTTQLPSATDRPVFPSGKDFHPSVGAYSQAHMSQALRARLRSHCPSGTKAIRPSRPRIKLALMGFQPGVLTPGKFKKDSALKAAADRTCQKVEREHELHATCYTRASTLAKKAKRRQRARQCLTGPFRANPRLLGDPALKRRAKSRCPFGHDVRCDIEMAPKSGDRRHRPI